MPNMYSAPGTENLRADAHNYDGPEKSTPGGSAKDAGGTENLKESTTVKQGSVKSIPSLKDSHPAGVQPFSEGSV